MADIYVVFVHTNLHSTTPFLIDCFRCGAICAGKKGTVSMVQAGFERTTTDNQDQLATRLEFSEAQVGVLKLHLVRIFAAPHIRLTDNL